MASGVTIPLASQVGGHAGVQVSEDGSILIKPALPLEHRFYQSLTADPAFAALRHFVPKFFGTLKLEGKVDEATGQPVMTEGEGPQKESLVLENLSHPFYHPNILDIKLGTVLYDESASPEKVERMLKTAAETTSLETGVRLTGFQVYDHATNLAVNTPKSYGKSIKASQLPEGIAKFFPVATTEQTQGLPAETLLPILEALREDIAEIRDAFAGIEMRMVGGSLLIIYEGDIDRAKAGAEWMNTAPSEEEDAEGDDDDDEEPKQGPPYVVKLIDFAHTRIVPGQGADEGVLKGFDTVLQLIDGRIKEVKEIVS